MPEGAPCDRQPARPAPTRPLPGGPLLAFSGGRRSYGGMLGTWFRCKYPHLMDGVIAGSGGAPAGRALSAGRHQATPGQQACGIQELRCRLGPGRRCSPWSSSQA